MARTNGKSTGNGRSSAGRGRQPSRDEGGLMQPVLDAIRAHPVAAAVAGGAVAAGGAMAARMVRGEKSQPVAADTARKPKAAGKTKRAGGGGGGLSAPVKPDGALAAVVGSGALTRAELTKRLWDYIKQNNLQDAANRRMINADARLRPIFGKDQVSMFEMTRLVNQHVTAGG